MELVDSQLCSATAEKDTFAPAVGLEFLRVLCCFKITGSGISIEFCASFFTRGQVSQVLEVVIEEVYMMDPGDTDIKVDADYTYKAEPRLLFV